MRRFGGAQCQGVTKSGKQCSITAASQMRDFAGRLVALPLCCGGSYCMLHAVFFSTLPAQPRDAIVVAYLDLETSSLDFLSGSIVEIACLICGTGGVFSTVVQPCRSLPEDPCAVHGISHDELRQGPSFATAFERMVRFLDYVSLSVPEETDTDSDDARSPSRSMTQEVGVTLVAHNGRAFDFPFLASACLRSGVDVSPMSRWHYVDTLDLLRAADATGCNKLQCAFHRACAGPSCLRAHRALDDCVALRHVVRHVSASFGVAPSELLRQFTFGLDAGPTVAQLSAMIAMSSQS